MQSAAPTRVEPKPNAWVHATALVIGEAGLLIRGPSGSGKSRLALDLLTEAGRRGMFARLVGDDRVSVAARGGRLVVCPHPTIAGRIESRGAGILEVGFEPAVIVRLVIDVTPAGADAPQRLPARDPTARLGELDLPVLTLDGSEPRSANVVLDHLWRMRNG